MKQSDTPTVTVVVMDKEDVIRTSFGGGENEMPVNPFE